MLRTIQSISILVCVYTMAVSVPGQINNWDTGEVISGTEGITAGPGVDLSLWNTDSRNLRYADFSGGLDLQNARFSGSWLDHARFSHANLTRVDFSEASLANVEIVGASIEGADFGATTARGFTKEQLYSTASYQSRELSGISLNDNDLRRWNLSDVNLEQAILTLCDMTDATLSNSIITRSVMNGSELRNANLSNSDLTGTHFILSTLQNTDLRNANLTSTSFWKASLTDADLTGAIVAGAVFGGPRQTPSNLSKEQLYSTASYTAKELPGIDYRSMDLSGWNLEGQNLADSDFRDTATVNAVLSAADLRGSTIGSVQLSVATVRNTILDDGVIEGVDLLADDTLKIRDYGRFDRAIPITVESRLQMDALSTLEIIFEDADWNSTITLSDGVIADLDGTLFLDFRDETEVVSLVGTTFNIFNWNGSLINGDEFNDVSWPAGFDWDVRDLYAGGTVTLLAVPEPSSAAAFLLTIFLLRRR